MGNRILTLLLLLLSANCFAQDTVITLVPSMTYNDRIQLAKLDGWVFKKGDDTAWAKPDLNTADWMKMRPAQLLNEKTDKDGKLEGWLRIKIKLDTPFEKTPVDLYMFAWAATEVYLDGKIYNTYGNTGRNGQPFKEYRPIAIPPTPVTLQPGVPHVLAIHFVDKHSIFRPNRLKSEFSLSDDFLCLTNMNFRKGERAYFLEMHFYRGMWVSVNFCLSLLFWLLVFLNPGEKNLRLIAMASSIFTLFVIFNTQSVSTGISNFLWLLSFYLAGLFESASVVFGLILMLRVFNQKITNSMKVILLVTFGLGVINLIYQFQSVLLIQTALVIACYIYYIIKSWKSLRGAQWSIVFGFLAATAFGLSLVALLNINKEGGFIPFFHIVESGLYLSMPLSMLVYVSIRFKEIITEVRSNAKQVIQLSEEKKEQALSQQKVLEAEVKSQTAEIRNTLENLKATQSQLIRSEKMASLGELTAGIAHEIQNPLNFVNNFSELNRELVNELNVEIEKGDLTAAKNIAKDIADNEGKINEHGKRADSIVKGMLQHSRVSTGVKEPTDVNALCDEYIRLCFHGLRAKDKNFSANFETHLDPSVPIINVVPQDLGRVLLNVCNNAFYDVAIRRKKEEAGFQPVVSLTTRFVPGKFVEIVVKDNGNGIPQRILDKIFQPFFTTKPTGQGTGLGLSMSFDIIKAHGGNIEVKSKEGEGSEFIIQLPINTEVKGER